MKATAQIFPVPQPDFSAQATASGRNLAIDTMRGIAILMVVAIHSLQQPLDSPWQVLVDAALRPCVPMFLFASGYLTALSGRVPLAKRIKAALIPYAIAFVAAYIYMSLQNPAMDHRLATTVARFVLAYVFVYYYVFVYVGCTLCLWLVLRLSGPEAPPTKPRLVVLLMLSIAFGLIAGSYLDPLLTHLGFSGALTEEVRMRDIPFWFSFAAVGALVAQLSARRPLCDMRWTIAGAVLSAYVIYAAVRLFGIGDAADYDSVAFFGYAATLCILLFALDIQLPFVAALGSGSYFIYLWHIFIVMALRDQMALRQYGAAVGSGVIYMVTMAASILALLAVRRFCTPRLVRWLGA
jgi:surface polysaccharide O-acyltransferase-like enzyme